MESPEVYKDWTDDLKHSLGFGKKMLNYSKRQIYSKIIC